MQVNQEQALALKELFGNEVSIVNEGGTTFIYIQNTIIPGGVDTLPVDLLFSSGPWGGYDSRLLYSRQVQTREPRNWNTLNVRIAEKNWNAFSWRATPGLSIAQTILLYLGAAK